MHLNFSCLNFDSGAKILGDIIKYDYDKEEAKEEEKKKVDASREKEGHAARGNKKKNHGEKMTGDRVRLKVKSCRGKGWWCARGVVHWLLERWPVVDTGWCSFKG